MKDKCVMCRKETPFDETVPIDYRSGYVEGVGQLCYNCYTKAEPDYSLDTIQVSKDLVLNTSNDMELGAAVRKMIYDKLN